VAKRELRFEVGQRVHVLTPLIADQHKWGESLGTIVIAGVGGGDSRYDYTVFPDAYLDTWPLPDLPLDDPSSYYGGIRFRDDELEAVSE